MLCGVIDMGSNSVRLSLYRYEGNVVGFEPLLNKKITAGLAGYVKNGILTEPGISRACEALTELYSAVQGFQLDKLAVFATASLRNVSNTAEAVREIRERTGLSVEILSGEQEAALDFTGALYAVKADSGLVVDIGGGSTELVAFRQGKILEAVSIPVGSLSLYTRYVKELLPTEKECDKMRHAVRKELAQLDELNDMEIPLFVGVGGSIRAAARLCNEMASKEAEASSATPTLELTQVRVLLRQVRKEPEKALESILRASPERVHTLAPGMIILDAVARKFGGNMVAVSRYGVREGYLLERILKFTAGECGRAD